MSRTKRKRSSMHARPNKRQNKVTKIKKNTPSTPVLRVRSIEDQSKATSEHVGKFLFYEFGLTEIPSHQVQVAKRLSGKLMQKKSTPENWLLVNVGLNKSSEISEASPAGKPITLSGIAIKDAFSYFD